MLLRLFLLFTIIPLGELFLLIKIGGHIGALNTVLIVIGTALLGAFLARLEGIRTLQQISHSLSQGILPAEELVDGLLIFAAGVLLVTPGILTDIFAFFLLIPRMRFYLKRWLRRKFDSMVASGNTRIYFRGGNWPPS